MDKVRCADAYKCPDRKVQRNISLSSCSFVFLTLNIATFINILCSKREHT